MVANLHLERLSGQFLFYLTYIFLAALAIPGVAAEGNTIVATNGEVLQALQDPNVAFLNSNGTITVYSPITGQEIPQGLASDGGGSGFSSCAIAWIAFSFTVGAPLLFLGFRGRRFTIGATIGLAASLACESRPPSFQYLHLMPKDIPAWAVFVNTLDDVGVSDIALTTVVLVLSGLGFLLGVLELSRVVGILILSTMGGFALGIRIILLRSGLLISNPSIFFVNWLIVALCGFACSILVIWKQRAGIVSPEHWEYCFCSPTLSPDLAQRMCFHGIISLRSRV